MDEKAFSDHRVLRKNKKRITMQKKDDIGGIPNVEWKKYYLFLEANWFRLIVIGFFIVFFFINSISDLLIE